MLSSFLLAIREGVEAALIVGIVLGTLQKLGRPDLNKFVWVGTILSVTISLGVGWGINLLQLEFSGIGEQIFEGAIFLVAASLLTWMVVWMAKTAPNIKQEIEAKATQSLAAGGIFMVSFFAILREGIELSLFIVAIRNTTDPTLTAIGTALGLASAILIGWLIFTSSIKLNVGLFFKVTNILLIVIAAGMVGYGVHELNEAGVIPTIIDPLWDINWLLSDNGSIGGFLKALFGYNGNPSLSEVIGYTGYLFIAFILSKTMNSPVKNQKTIQ